MDGYIHPPFQLMLSTLEPNAWVITDSYGKTVLTRKRAGTEHGVRADEINQMIDAQMKFVVNAMNTLASKGMTV